VDEEGFDPPLLDPNSTTKPTERFIMKIGRTLMAALLTLSLCTVALAAGDKHDKLDNGGNKQNANSPTNQNQGQKQANQNQNQNQNQDQNSNSNKNTNSDNKVTNPGSVLKTPNNKVSNDNKKFDSKKNLGDNNFDKNGIGSLDEKKFSNEKDNKWRYSRKGNAWWYWAPGGYWMYWRNGDWSRYNVDNYVDALSGPYYEDDNGFYSLQGDRKVYDPQIRRVGSR
jgi:hypothetical protein